jgi:hypothetical protein
MQRGLSGSDQFFRLSIRADFTFHTPCIHYYPKKRKSE